jgi:hypothetical protein
MAFRLYFIRTEDMDFFVSSQELTAFDSCFKDFRVKQAKQKAFEESGKIPVGKNRVYH